MARHAKRTQASHARLAAQLRTLPEAWMQVHVYRTREAALGAVQRLRTGRAAAYQPPGAYEARLRMVDDGHAVDARYVGDGGECDG